MKQKNLGKQLRIQAQKAQRLWNKRRKRDRIRKLENKNYCKIINFLKALHLDLENKPKLYKLDALIHASNIKFQRLSPYNLVRKQFTESKSFSILSNKFFNILSNCFICGKESSVSHHIILLKNGGINDALNIVPLCNKCHCAIHPWMQSKSIQDFNIDSQ
jgi:hypothetical protein